MSYELKGVSMYAKLSFLISLSIISMAVTAECKVSTLLDQTKSDNKEVQLGNTINKKSSSRNLGSSLDSL
ncbi:MAG: hypothetical protein MRQ09_02380 [Candidatus Midichloria sp.]|nr:hypothetical protein [Candidatus Midichloria sp.]